LTNNPEPVLHEYHRRNDPERALYATNAEQIESNIARKYNGQCAWRGPMIGPIIASLIV